MSNTATLNVVDYSQFSSPKDEYRNKLWTNAAKIGITLLVGSTSTFVVTSDVTPTRRNEYRMENNSFSSTTLIQLIEAGVMSMDRNQNYIDGAPIVGKVYSYPFTPEISSLSEDASESNSRQPERFKRSWVREAELLFPGIRDFTKEESEKYEASLNKIFKPTGRNLFDYDR